MLFGYADESGEPGIAKSDHDYFVFCIILFKTRPSEHGCADAFAGLRRKLNLPETHEFHYATDSKKTRAEFINFLEHIDFRFISVSIKKNSSSRTSSFSRMADLILKALGLNNLSARIVIDTNPRLLYELKQQEKKYNLDLRFSERKSRGNDMIQLADYVVAIKTHFLKHPEKITFRKSYGMLINKLMLSLDV